MKDNIDFKGYFKIQAIDQNNVVIDEWEDNNMIMETARESMAEMFANLDSSTFMNQFKIGTMGHVGENILQPKGTNEGFVKTRTRMFSENITVSSPGSIAVLRTGDVVYYDIDEKYYEYLGDNTTNYSITDGSEFENTTYWTDLGDTAPYWFGLDFTMPGTSTSEDGDPASVSSEFDSLGNALGGGTSQVLVKKSGTSVTFTFDISTESGNLQTGVSSIFTEASLWANSRIFAMKTFKAKAKDSTVLLRIIWTITF